MHAGTPECYYHEYSKTIEYANASVTALNNRATSEYLNSDYACLAHMMSYDEAYAITGNTNATTNDLRYIGASGTTSNSAPYYLATAYSANILYGVNNNGNVSSYSINSFGVRPVVVLKSGIKTTGKGTDVVGQAWTLVKP